MGLPPQVAGREQLLAPRSALALGLWLARLSTSPTPAAMDPRLVLVSRTPTQRERVGFIRVLIHHIKFTICAECHMALLWMIESAADISGNRNGVSANGVRRSSPRLSTFAEPRIRLRRCFHLRPAAAGLRRDPPMLVHSSFGVASRPARQVTRMTRIKGEISLATTPATA